MRLNSIKPADGSTKKRVRPGRGPGSGTGKTAGRGHKGQKSRAGGFHKTGFEGGQMPLQRRLPKIGFRSFLTRKTAEIRLGELEKLDGEVVDLAALKKANLVSKGTKYAKIFASGELTRARVIRGIRVSKGARAAIEAAGGRIE